MSTSSREPWILSSDSLHRIRRQSFRAGVREHWGELALYLHQLPEKGRDGGRLDLPGVLEDNLAVDWQVGLAAELLLLEPQKRVQLEHGLPDDLKLFGDQELCWGQLKDCQAAAALFPLAGEKNLPPMRIWAFRRAAALQTNIEGLDGQGRLLPKATQEDVVLYLENPDDLKISGRSWQLAAALALDSLVRNASISTRLELATRRIVTGALDESTDNVFSVLVGNKLEGVATDRQRRIWMLPDCDKEHFLDAAKACGEEIPSRFFSTLEAAYRDIAGYGARPSAEQIWPDKVEVMHALVGGTISAILAPLLYCCPQKLYLWHSANEYASKQPAEMARALIDKYMPELRGKVQVAEMPSNSVANAEEVLRQPLSDRTAGEVWFNVTSGNRLMMLAVDCLARADKRIQLIYRDFDEKTLAYVHNWHEDGHFHTGLLMPRLGDKLKGAVLKLLQCKKDEVESYFAGAIAVQKESGTPD